MNLSISVSKACDIIIFVCKYDGKNYSGKLEHDALVDKFRIIGFKLSDYYNIIIDAIKAIGDDPDRNENMVSNGKNIIKIEDNAITLKIANRIKFAKTFELSFDINISIPRSKEIIDMPGLPTENLEIIVKEEQDDDVISEIEKLTQQNTELKAEIERYSKIISRDKGYQAAYAKLLYIIRETDTSKFPTPKGRINKKHQELVVENIELHRILDQMGEAIANHHRYETASNMSKYYHLGGVDDSYKYI